jgi:hypothetical protein
MIHNLTVNKFNFTFNPQVENKIKNKENKDVFNKAFYIQNVNEKQKLMEKKITSEEPKKTPSKKSNKSVSFQH